MLSMILIYSLANTLFALTIIFELRKQIFEDFQEKEQKFRKKFFIFEKFQISQKFHPICNIKSWTWQHIWCSKSIFKICQKSRFFENIKIMDGCWFELSTWAHDAIFDARSNIASLVLIFNKNVVFRQEMMIYQDSVHSFK